MHDGQEKEQLRRKDQQHGCGVFKEGSQKSRQTQMWACDSQGRAATIQPSHCVLRTEHQRRQMPLLQHKEMLHGDEEIAKYLRDN